jgi:hypothetical protein
VAHATLGGEAAEAAGGKTAAGTDGCPEPGLFCRVQRSATRQPTGLGGPDSHVASPLTKRVEGVGKEEGKKKFLWPWSVRRAQTAGTSMNTYTCHIRMAKKNLGSGNLLRLVMFE